MGAGVLFHLKTAYLFIRSDIKTILFPVSGFAFMVSKGIWTTRLILVPVWVLTHLFLIDIDNQSLSVDEDKLNKPWRPLPSGHLTISAAKFLSKALNVICLLVSCLLGGRELMIPTVVFCSLVYLYDHLLLNSHYIWKNIINGLGYEMGATMVLIGSLPRKPNMILALVLSWAIICTTVHVQDLADIEGDQKMGRRTTAIHLRENVTRVSIVVFLAKVHTFLGIFLGARIFFLHQKVSDEMSFHIYNVKYYTLIQMATISN
ncbi:hypothetical protein L208DRAFT_1411645 [Tricholoma matsutake]|nr:hypothetical protein L208DRAFT_1411645 [Tricholoma matsutake 945]